MAPQMYSVDQVAVLLGLHVRTVRAYIRDGRLKAVRIGKQYRIAAQDLAEFTGGSTAVAETEGASGGAAEVATGGSGVAAAAEVEVSSIVRIDGIDAVAMDRLATLLHASVAHRPDRVPLRVETVRDEARRTMKIIVLGGAEDSAEILRLVGAVAADISSP
ncbi:helix-turn-helix domain-containing protein [Kitasatospora sp. NBC_01250]|uniref:helix-turn-helix domain-containing protein n=1 Tax=unclassified Kitasatospora TaxID=2633591 RepID=UPI002E140AC8|nr:MULTISPECIES: helix-turn-helix domain-containing protein [unclassified Kitasatospora]WSJ66154.1 helix-turn-helix domain-containing protein [Kitasatospora sp. NBC_01302]